MWLILPQINDIHTTIVDISQPFIVYKNRGVITWDSALLNFSTCELVHSLFQFIYDLAYHFFPQKYGVNFRFTFSFGIIPLNFLDSLLDFITTILHIILTHHSIYARYIIYIHWTLLDRDLGATHVVTKILVNVEKSVLFPELKLVAEMT